MSIDVIDIQENVGNPGAMFASFDLIKIKPSVILSAMSLLGTSGLTKSKDPYPRHM
jgi:hypothetical protein